MTTAADLTPEELAEFRAAARKRYRAEQEALVKREQAARGLAVRAATTLREQFGVERIALFGSLVHPGCFTRWSDVDVAAWGIRAEDTLRAMEVVADLSAEIAVNLVDVAACRASLRRVIEAEGEPL